MNNKNKAADAVIYIILILLAAAFLAPVLIVLMNSFKGQFYISSAPFSFPDSTTFSGFVNYTAGIAKT